MKMEHQVKGQSLSLNQEQIYEFKRELTALLNKHFTKDLKYGGYIESGPFIKPVFVLVDGGDIPFIDVHIDGINFRILRGD